MRHALRSHVLRRTASLPCTYQLAALTGRKRTITHTSTPTRKPKEEGSIASVFSSLSGSGPELPTRFSDLKKDIWRDALAQSWREVLNELEGSIEKVAARGADVLELAFMSATTDTNIFIDNTICTILGLAERTIDGSNIRNPERRCPDCPGRRTK